MKFEGKRERRKHRRYGVQEGTVAVFENTESRLGPVQDISSGGLSFIYFAENDWINEPDKMGIFYPGEGFYLGKVPYKTVYDKADENSDPFSFLQMNKRGIRFGKMNQYQKSLLDHFIENYTLEKDTTGSP